MTDAPPAAAVWLDLDQAALDRAYDQVHWASNMADLGKRRAVASVAAIARLGAPEVVAYGTSPVETYDLFRTKAPNAPVLVFIHGGAWRTGTARDYAFVAEAYVNAGAHVAVLDFTSVDAAGGSLFPMVEQVRRAVAHVYGRARDFGGDPARLYVTGHSSGAHLTGNVAVTDWSAFGLPRDTLKGVLASSGMYDLAPVRLSARSKYVAFTDAMEHELSSQRHLGRLACPLILAYGTQESPEFQRQSRDMAAAVEKAGKKVELIVAEGCNHFEMLEQLANPYGVLAQPLLTMMGLESAFSTKGA